MNEERSAYRQVFKATSLFGGVQVFQILIAVIRSKVIAVLLGPFGMGISGLLFTTLNFISELTGAGLDRSAVKDVSAAYGKKDEQKIVRVLGVLRRLVWFTGILGAVVTIALSPFLSQWAFDSDEFTLAFIWIAVAILLKQLAYGNLAVLQGLRKLKSLAKANLMGSTVGLVIVVPLYYYFRIDAIAPAIVISFLLTFLFSRYYAKQVRLQPEKVTTKEAFSQGKEMIRLGVMMSISSLLVALGMFLVQLFISNTGSVAEVGFYHAGIVIINSYVGMIFNAMSTDYYPRLAAIADDIEKIRETVLHQAYIAVLLITPIIVLFLIFAEYVIILLYSREFLPVVTFLVWAILGTIFKAVSFSMGYIFIAKGDSKIFMKTAVLFNVLLLIMNIAGYHFGGLLGLGISFFVYYVLHLILVGTITKVVYNFYFPKSFYTVFLICLACCLLTFGSLFIDNLFLKFLNLAVLLAVSVSFSFYLLNKKMDLMEVVKGYINKFWKD
jgi:O-antigen/teichoic acid export membrane protein